MIHPLAFVSPAASIAADVSVGPFCVVEDDVAIGAGCRLEPHVILKSGVRLGDNNHIYEGCVIGGFPQHTRPPQRPGRVDIGSNNVLREHVTIHRPLRDDEATVVGDNNLLMINVHVAHDCRLGSGVIVANNVMLAGHVHIDDRAYISGAVGIHQFCRVGRLAMVGGQAHIVKDVPPYVTVDGASSFVVGLNLVGLRRAGFKTDDIAQLKLAYRLIYRAGLKWSEILQRLPLEFTSGPAVEFHRFFQGGNRGFTHERRIPLRPTLKLPTSQEAPPTRAKAG